MRDVVEILTEQCSAGPFDAGAHGALADILEERGVGGMAAALRWMARTGFRPAKRGRPRVSKRLWGWAWWHERSAQNYVPRDFDRLDIEANPQACLPRCLFVAMLNSRGGAGLHDHWYGPTWEEAVRVLDGGVRLLASVAAGEVGPAGVKGA